ncbi:unnamed protein product [Paramecium pentaurelia]|uniref:Uncharacterized protein n=1 Tax=Paramecium pentaurelia TaxID=43138 RepID=A0A8S1WA78_9CILI|nr:unnamed protein product [Paramecium pentaurelia]
MSTMVCTKKGCQHKTLCSDCIVTHPKNHLVAILPLRDFDSSNYSVPKTIAKDLSIVRQRISMLLNHLIQTREILKSECKRLQKHIVNYFIDKLDSFIKTIILQIEQFYNENILKLKFDFLLDLQEKLLQVIVSTLTKQAEELNRSFISSDILINQNFEKAISFVIKKVFFVSKILKIEQKPVVMDEPEYDSLTILKVNLKNQQKNIDFYQSTIQPYLHSDLLGKEYKVPQSSDFVPKTVPKETPQLNGLHFEIFISQQKHLNTVVQGHLDITTGFKAHKLQFYNETITCLGFHKYLFSAGLDKTLRVWEIKDQAILVKSIIIHTEQISQKLIITGSQDKRVRIVSLEYVIQRK